MAKKETDMNHYPFGTPSPPSQYTNSKQYSILALYSKAILTLKRNIQKPKPSTITKGYNHIANKSLPITKEVFGKFLKIWKKQGNSESKKIQA